MYKFQVQIVSGQMINLNKDRFTQMLRGSKDGDYELLWREKVEWNVEQMRKYFHGPALDFIREELKKLKRIYAKKKIKEMLKEELGPRELVEIGKRKIWDAKSTGDYAFDEYKKFLCDLDQWCIDCFKVGLPPAEEVE